MRWLDTLVLGVYVFDLTGSAFMVALLFFTRQVPRILFSLAIGTLADRVDRRRMLMACFGLLTIIAALLGVLVVTERIEYWHLLGLLSVVRRRHAVGRGVPRSARDAGRRRAARADRSRDGA